MRRATSDELAASGCSQKRDWLEHEHETQAGLYCCYLSSVSAICTPATVAVPVPVHRCGAVWLVPHNTTSPYPPSSVSGW